jgi:AcrR family transcriptional regulator
MAIKNKELELRRPKTQRGQEARESILAAAEALLIVRRLEDVSISELARESGVVRASLFFHFPDGWPDIACALFIDIFFQRFEGAILPLLDKMPTRTKASDTVRVLKAFFDLAGETGLLVANLRAQMFVWGEENQGIWQCGVEDSNACLGALLAGGDEKITKDHLYAAEGLINIALDLAAGAGSYPHTAKEKLALLKRNVELTTAGLK